MKWNQVLTLNRNGVINITGICNIEIKKRRESLFFSKLSSISFAKGDRETALELAERSLLHSSESGWVKHYDGGSRMNAFNALRDIDPAAASVKAFNFFAHDILNSNYPKSYIQELEDILPLLTMNYDSEKYWPEIFDYLKRLMTNSQDDIKLPDLVKDDIAADHVFIDYLVYLSRSPIVILKERALKLLAQAIDQGNSYAEDLCSDSRDDQFLLENQSTIMSLLHLMNSDKLEKFVPVLKNHAENPNYALRRKASQILESLKVPFAAPAKITLPAFYNLDLGKGMRLSIPKEPDSFFSSIDTKNALELLQPFRLLIGLLSEESGLEKNNIIERAYYFMKLIGNPEKWEVNYEIGIRDHLGKINLKYSFRRHRVADAWFALMHVVGELQDSGVIDMEEFAKYFTISDLNLSFFKEEQKPDFVANLTEKSYGGVSLEWLDKINDALRADSVLELEYGLKVIAEYSYVKCMDWGEPTEIIMSQISSSDEISDSYEIYGPVFQAFTSDYYDLRNTGPAIIIVRNNRLEHFNIKSNWIAVNPVLARFLGWEPQIEKLFAWKDKNGSTMVESIYWVSGNNYMLPRHDSEAGEGWFIAASDLAIQQIREAEPNLFFHRRVTRTKENKEKIIEDVTPF